MMKLKPCPFCGGEARIDRNIFAFPTSYSVICKICEAESEVFNTEKEVIEAWNRRVTDGTERKAD